ncbi:MAG: hypothetical protein ACM32E_13135 [Gemmatimonadota bacterium]
MSCASAGNCTAVGSYSDSSGTHQAMMLTKTAGTWAAGTEATLPADAEFSPFANLDSVSCSSAGNCTAVGYYTDTSRHVQGVLLTQTAGTWAAGTEAAPPANAGADPAVSLGSVSCASAGNCAAVGSYTDSSGGTQGLLLTQATPIPTCPGSGLLIANQAPSQTGTPGTSGTWSFTVTAQNCTGGDLHAMKLQGSTAGWISDATATASPATGTVSIKGSQTVTWTGFALPDRASASITVTVSGTVPKGTTCGSSLPISSSWSATGVDANNKDVNSKNSPAATIQITC